MSRPEAPDRFRHPFLICTAIRSQTVDDAGDILKPAIRQRGRNRPRSADIMIIRMLHGGNPVRAQQNTRQPFMILKETDILALKQLFSDQELSPVNISATVTRQSLML